MDTIIIETPITVEPIDEKPTPLDLANWLTAYFPGVTIPMTGPAEPTRLPTIEW